MVDRVPEEFTPGLKRLVGETDPPSSISVGRGRDLRRDGVGRWEPRGRDRWVPFTLADLISLCRLVDLCYSSFVVNISMTLTPTEKRINSCVKLTVIQVV